VLPRLLLAVLLLAPLAEARERAVLIYPREHSWFRRVFYTRHQRELRAQLAGAYDLDVREQVASADDLFDTDITGAKLLVLSAHGDPFSMYFGGKTRRTIDARDRAKLERFFDRLDPFATIVLQSCDVGQGFAHVVKKAAGPTRRVIAARGTIPAGGMRITSVVPFDVAIDCADGGHVWDCTLRLR
jgi:hypothetical protein